jgi:hypothetical protein|nr:hypothetical protein [Kofleriaceae bacterium]
MTADSIVGAITQLVRTAPTLDPELVDGLVVDLRAHGTPLSLAIARIVELVGEQLVDPGVALPALAMACDTLARSTDPVVLDAARYEIETLQPMPDRELVTISLSPPRRT